MVDGDADRALRTAAAVPDDMRPAVTYQRFRLDLAAAQLERRRPDEALAVLLQLHTTVPGWLRHQRYAQRLTAQLLHTQPRKVPAKLRDLADFLGVA
jgi:hypothetical protein